MDFFSESATRLAWIGGLLGGFGSSIVAFAAETPTPAPAVAVGLSSLVVALVVPIARMIVADRAASREVAARHDGAVVEADKLRALLAVREEQLAWHRTQSPAPADPGPAPAPRAGRTSQG